MVKKDRLYITIDRTLKMKIMAAENFNASAFCNEMLQLRFNSVGKESQDKTALKDKIKALESEINAQETKLYKHKIELQEIEEKDRLKREEEEHEAEQLVRGLRANNPLRDL